MGEEKEDKGTCAGLSSCNRPVVFRVGTAHSSSRPNDRFLCRNGCRWALARAYLSSYLTQHRRRSCVGCRASLRYRCVIYSWLGRVARTGRDATVKVRFQNPSTAGKYQSTAHAMVTIARSEGFSGLFKGLSSPLVRRARYPESLIWRGHDTGARYAPSVHSPILFS